MKVIKNTYTAWCDGISLVGNSEISMKLKNTTILLVGIDPTDIHPPIQA